MTLTAAKPRHRRHIRFDNAGAEAEPGATGSHNEINGASNHGQRQPQLNQPSRHETDATVFIVDDDPDIRRAISLLVRSIGLNVKLFSSAIEFLDCVTGDEQGCLVLDLRMLKMTGLELQQELNARGFTIPVIFISAHGDIPAATAALRAGAVDFLPKPFRPQVLLERIHEAISIDSQRQQERHQQSAIESRLALLTNRERQVMQLLAAGDSSKVIAASLSISQKTVDNHRASILDKMAVDNAAQLALLVGDYRSV